MVEKFSQEVWDEIVEATASVLRLTKEEKDLLGNSPVAKLVAGIGYASEFKHPRRYAVANLTTLWAGKVLPKVYGAVAGESLGERLESFTYPETLTNSGWGSLHYGLALLKKISLEDHKNDVKQDILDSKVNPLVNGDYSYDEINISIATELKSYQASLSPVAVSTYAMTAPATTNGSWL